MTSTASTAPSKPTRCGVLWSAILRFWASYRHNWHLFLFGQSIALCLALVSSASSTIEAQYGVVIPTTMSGVVYFVLSLHLIRYTGTKAPSYVNEESTGLISSDTSGISRNEEGFGDLQDSNARNSTSDASPAYILPFTYLRIRAPWWNYLIIAALDVESNYIFMQAFRYTSLTSAQLLSSLAVPSAMLFSRLILRRSFRAQHFVGAATCLSGGVIMILSDWVRHGSEDDDGRYARLHPHSFLGDLFAVIGATMYGLTDTIAEHFVKNVSRVEYLGMLGLFGVMVSFVQAAIVEWEEIAKLMDASDSHRMEVMLIVGWYAACLVYVYIGFSHFLAVADVTLLILSLQTAPMWATIFSVVVQNITPSPLFYIAVLVMVSGVFIYETTTTGPAVSAPVDNGEEIQGPTRESDGIGTERPRKADVSSYGSTERCPLADTTIQMETYPHR